MDYDGVNSIVCDAEENDWLDVSYSERKYVQEEQPATKKRKWFNFNFKFPKINLKLSKPLKITLVAVLVVALLAAMLFIDGKFATDVFQTAKAAFAGSVFDNSAQDVYETVTIPSNVDLVDVANGVATFSGGKVALSFTDGVVTNVTETSVTVAINDTTTITYDNLTEVMVAVGDKVSANTLLARYDGTFTASVSVDGQVKDVVGSETQLAWNV